MNILYLSSLVSSSDRDERMVSKVAENQGQIVLRAVENQGQMLSVLWKKLVFARDPAVRHSITNIKSKK